MTVEAPEERLQIQHCGGRDLISNRLLISPDGKLIFVNGENKVTVFNAETGQPIRKLNTGAAVGLGFNKDKPTELLVALPTELVTWDHELAKVVSREKYFGSDLKKSLLEVIFPSNFSETKECYGIVKDRNQLKMIRVDIHNSKFKEIFTDVKLGSLHVGNNDSCVLCIADKGNSKDAQVLCYDRSLSITQKFSPKNPDREFKVARCHPTKKIFAIAETRMIFLVYGNEKNEKLHNDPRASLSWHHCCIRALAWSPEGSHLYSGGDERVLCKWFIEENSKPYFTPRIGSEILGVENCGSGVAVQLANNSVKIIDSQGKGAQELIGLCRNTQDWPAGLVWNNRSKSLHLNGNTGHIQVFYPETKDTLNLDVARENFLNKEDARKPVNSEVEAMALSEDGMFMVTVDACMTEVPRILMKFWHFAQSTQEFVLHTQIDSPHRKGVRELKFKPESENGPVTIISVGCDKVAKLWVLNDDEEGQSCWSCQYLFQFRGLECNTAAWSTDGSVLVIAFQYIVAIFDKACQLKTTLTALDDKLVTINHLTFGQGLKQGLFLCATTSTMLCVWNLITLECKTTRLSFVIKNLISDPKTGNLVAVGRDVIEYLRMGDFSTVAKFDGPFNGAAVFGMFKSTPVLYFINGKGLMKMIGYKLFTEEYNTMTVKKVNHFLAARRSAFVPKEIEAESRKKTSDDINSLLAVPLHAVPSNTSLAVSFLTNRVRGLPKTRTAGTTEQLERLEAEPPVGRLAAKTAKYRAYLGFYETKQKPVNYDEFAKHLELIKNN